MCTCTHGSHHHRKASCACHRYQYDSQQQSNQHFLYPRIRDAWGTDAADAEQTWNFKVEEERGVCMQSFLWVYDAKWTTTHAMCKAAQNGQQDWGEWTRGPVLQRNARVAAGLISQGVTKTQECWAYCKVWLQDCTDGDHCPLAGEWIEIDPVDHLEVYNEYKADMTARQQGTCKHLSTQSNGT